MLFNSLEFIFGFVPVVLVGYYLLVRRGLARYLFGFLIVASLAFYSVWNPPYVLLLILSVLANYAIGLWIARNRDREGGLPPWATVAFGITANLLLLGYYKYSHFFVENLNVLTGNSWQIGAIVLPLGISFYTFQQIAFLVDVSRNEVQPQGVARYATFVIFFPQLIAGPIVHYREIVPQFFGRGVGSRWRTDLAVGFTIFSIGLAKKTCIADTAALFSTPIFDAAAAHHTIGLFDAWQAATAYTIQLYFDFSGYSDMAIGLARLFGIRLPVNFHSPLRASGIIEYWRRWHITLQHFIVSYLFQPMMLPLARLAAGWGFARWGTFLTATAVPTVLVFVVIGLWHGAGWTFVLFGLMHGCYLSLNELWRELRRRARRRRKRPSSLLAMGAYHLITLLAILVGNVMFRAESAAAAFRIYSGMVTVQGTGAALADAVKASWSAFVVGPVPFLLIAYATVFLAPNTQQIMRRYRPVLDWKHWNGVAESVVRFEWRMSAGWAVVAGLIFFLGVSFIMRGQSEFIYFNF